MRWPIQLQLLLPMLTVVVLAIALASLGSAYLGGIQVRRTQEENLARTVATLAEARFPLSEPVLRQMSGLSGAEFVLFSRRGTLEVATLPLSGDDLEQLRHTRSDKAAGKLASRPATSVAGRSFLCQRVTVSAHNPLSTGSLVVLYPEDRWSGVMWQAAYPALMTGAVATIAIVLIATVLAHRFVQPIRQLGDRAAAIAQGDFQPVVVSRRNDEIRDLALSINRMAEQLGQYELQVRRHEQFRTLDQLGAGMAHQLRNAATGARMAIELHHQECMAGPADESLEVALRQLHLMESYLQRFMALDRDELAVAEDLCLATVVKDALSLVRPTCVHAGIALTFDVPAQPFQIRGDPEVLRQLIVNLTLNAVDAIGRQSKGRPRISVALETTDPDRVAIHVRDTGPGPLPEVADRLFEPFVTEKPEGAGLGLYVARQVAEDHHGAIRWQREDSTTCFTVELPLISSIQSLLPAP